VIAPRGDPNPDLALVCVRARFDAYTGAVRKGADVQESPVVILGAAGLKKRDGKGTRSGCRRSSIWLVSAARTYGRGCVIESMDNVDAPAARESERRYEPRYLAFLEP